MGEAFIVRRGGGGIGKLFAAIGVEYPAGSECSCSNGTKTLKAKDTSGKWLFAIPEAGTWTVTATDGTNSKSVDVEIGEQGQSLSATLSFELTLYDAGNEYTEITGGWTVSGSASLKSTYINCVASAQNQANAYTTNMIDLTPFTTLHITISSVSTDLFVGVPSVIKSTVEATKNGASHKIQPTRAGTHTLDISSVNESRYVWCGNWSESENSFGARVSKVWLT